MLSNISDISLSIANGTFHFNRLVNGLKVNVQLASGRVLLIAQLTHKRAIFKMISHMIDQSFSGAVSISTKLTPKRNILMNFRMQLNFGPSVERSKAVGIVALMLVMCGVFLLVKL